MFRLWVSKTFVKDKHRYVQLAMHWIISQICNFFTLTVNLPVCLLFLASSQYSSVLVTNIKHFAKTSGNTLSPANMLIELQWAPPILYTTNPMNIFTHGCNTLKGGQVLTGSYLQFRYDIPVCSNMTSSHTSGEMLQVALRMGSHQFRPRYCEY